MKKILLIIAIFPLSSFAQLKMLLGGKNAIKTNLMDLAIKNYNITYERSILKRMSLSIGYRFMPKSNLPPIFVNKIADFIKDEDISLNGLQLGNRAFTAELRLYAGIGKISGFYIAPYFRSASFDLTIPIENDSSKANPIVFNGKINAKSLGILLGKQWVLGNHIVLDFYIIGGHVDKDVTTSFRADNIIGYENPNQLDNALGKTFDKRIGLWTFKAKAESNNSASLVREGTLYGIRAMTISLGVKF